MDDDDASDEGDIGADMQAEKSCVAQSLADYTNDGLGKYVTFMYFFSFIHKTYCELMFS